MFNVKNLKIIFLALLLAGAMPVLCMADGTRVNLGAYTNFGSTSLNLVVMLANPSDSPINITEIKIYRPDGTLEASPNFVGGGLPGSSFTIGPFESKRFNFRASGIIPVTPPSPPVFQMHTIWESDGTNNGLKGYSVVATVNQFTGVVSKIAVEGFDIKKKKK